MSDNQPPLGIHPDQTLEARITAFVLGQASPFEAAELESLIEKSPELQLFLNRTRTLHTLLTEAETTSNTPSEDWKLPAEKRANLATILGDRPQPRPNDIIRNASFRAATGIAAILLLGFFVKRHFFVPPVSQTQSPTIVSYSARPEPPASSLDGVIASNGSSPIQVPVPSEETVPADFGAGADFGDGWGGRKQLAKKGKAREFDRLAASQPAAPARRESALAANEPASRSRSNAGFERGGNSEAKARKDGALAEADAFATPESTDGDLYGAPRLPQPAAKPTAPAPPLAANDGIESKRDQLDDARNKISEAPMEEAVAGLKAAESELGVIAGLRNTGNTEGELQLEAKDLPEIAKSELQPAPFADESAAVGRALYAHPPVIITEEIPAAQDPFSTFSLNISDVSFQITLAAIEKGEHPDPSSIKPEQFYNAVDYADPAPSSSEPVAAAIDQTAHPVLPGRNLVRVALRTASTGRSAAQPLRLTLLVDQSGSMVREDRRTAMETALAQLSTLLTENDQVTVIGFSRTPRLLADSLPGNQSAKLPDLINQTANEGGTNLEQAINLASELALRHKLPGAQNRIVLFTDGAANLGNADPDRLSKKIETLRQQGLAFDIAGIGTNDLNDNLLSELARHGNGRYYLVGGNTGTSFAAQLAGAFRPAAENVKVQVKLNPERVGNYKLIGFEKDRLKTEDFRNDSIGAAELAADEAGVAIYQVEPLPDGTGEIGEVSVRFRDTASGEMVERTWTIPYDPTTPAFDKADPKTQLATLSLLAAQKLQGGPLADAISFRNFSETIARLQQTYANDPKAQRMITLLNALK